MKEPVDQLCKPCKIVRKLFLPFVWRVQLAGVESKTPPSSEASKGEHHGRR